MYNPFKDKAKAKIGELHTSSIIRRYEGNPLLTAQDMPYEATYVFNAGVIRFKDKYFIAPRVIRYTEKFEPITQFTGLGVSCDGIKFDISPEPVRGFYHGEVLPWVNDSRLTVVDDELYLSFCFENQHSERPGIAKWRNDGTCDFDAVCIGGLSSAI